jgi:hypothetical protein
MNSQKWILIEAAGITKNFGDIEIDKISEEWVALKLKVDYDMLNRALTRMRSEFDRPAPRDGDIWEFGGGGTFRNISI